MVNCSFKKNVSPNNQGVENWQLTISAWGLIKAMESKISFIFRTVSKLFWLRESMKDKNYFITGLMHSCTKNLLQTWFILKTWSVICFIMTHEPWTGIAYDCLLSIGGYRGSRWFVKWYFLVEVVYQHVYVHEFHCVLSQDLAKWAAYRDESESFKQSLNTCFNSSFVHECSKKWTPSPTVECIFRWPFSEECLFIWFFVNHLKLAC